MANEPTAPDPVDYVEIAASGPSGLSGLRSSEFPGRRLRGELVEPPRAREPSSPFNGPHDTGPNTSLRQVTASMPNLLGANDPPEDDPQDEYEGAQRPRPRRSYSNSEMEDRRDLIPQNLKGSRENITQVFYSIMESQMRLQREYKKRDERFKREQLEFDARLKREENNRLAIERERERSFHRELVAMMARAFEGSRNQALTEPISTLSAQYTSTSASIAPTAHNGPRTPCPVKQDHDYTRAQGAPQEPQNPMGGTTAQ